MMVKEKPKFKIPLFKIFTIIVIVLQVYSLINYMNNGFAQDFERYNQFIFIFLLPLLAWEKFALTIPTFAQIMFSIFAFIYIIMVFKWVFKGNEDIINDEATWYLLLLCICIIAFIGFIGFLIWDIFTH